MERDDLIRPELQKYSRECDLYVKHNKFYNPRTYISIQERVNSDPEFEKYYFEKLITEGWNKLEFTESILDPQLKGRHFKYRLNGNGLSEAEKGIFRSGGIIIGMNNNNKEFILYKAYNGCIFPLQLSDILEIYIKDPNVKSTAIKPQKPINSTVFFKMPDKTTDFPVFLLDPITKIELPVYYARDNTAKDRFMMTKKFNYAFKTKDWAFN